MLKKKLVEDLNVSPVTRISFLLCEELIRANPDSNVVRNYTEAIKNLCSAQSSVNNRTYYNPPVSIKTAAKHRVETD